MALAHNQMYLQCEMYCALRPTDDVPTQLHGPVNFTKIETTPIEQEADDLISNMAGSVGEVLASVQKPTKPGQVSMECNTMPGPLLPLIMSADVAAYSQTSSAVTDLVVSTAMGIWTKFPAEYLSATGLSLKDASNAVVDPSKYKINRVVGAIMPLHADAVGVSMKLSGTKSAVTGDTYYAGKAISSYLYLTGKAYDKYANTWGVLTIERASVSNKQANDWVAGGWMKGALTGPLLTPLGANGPIKFTMTDFVL